MTKARKSPLHRLKDAAKRLEKKPRQQQITALLAIFVVSVVVGTIVGLGIQQAKEYSFQKQRAKLVEQEHRSVEALFERLDGATVEFDQPR